MYGEVVDGRRRAPLRAGAHRPEGASAACSRTSTSTPTTCASWSARSSSIYEDETGRAVPAGRARAAGARGPRRLRLVGHAARAGLPARARDPRRPRHRRQRRPDGLRQQGRRSGTGVASPATRRPASRASTASSSPTRRARTSSPASARPSRSSAMHERCREAFEQLLDTMRRLEEHYRDMQDIEFTVEDGPALPPADAHGEAHGRGGAEGGGRRWSTRG